MSFILGHCFLRIVICVFGGYIRCRRRRAGLRQCSCARRSEDKRGFVVRVAEKRGPRARAGREQQLRWMRRLAESGTDVGRSRAIGQDPDWQKSHPLTWVARRPSPYDPCPSAPHASERHAAAIRRAQKLARRA